MPAKVTALISAPVIMLSAVKGVVSVIDGILRLAFAVPEFPRLDVNWPVVFTKVPAEVAVTSTTTVQTCDAFTVPPE